MIQTEVFLKSKQYWNAYQLLRKAQLISGYTYESNLLERLLTCGISGQARRNNLKNAWFLKSLIGYNCSVYSVGCSPDNRFILSGGENGDVYLWEIANGKKIRQFKGHTQRITSIDFSLDGCYALTGSEDHLQILWEVSTGLKIRRFSGNLASFLLFENQCILFSEQDRKITITEIVTGKEIKCFIANTRLKIFEGYSIFVTTTCFSPDGRYILLGMSDGRIRLWDIALEKQVKLFDGHMYSIDFVCFSPGDQYLYALSTSLEEDTIRLWNVNTEEELQTFKGYKIDKSICFSPDGKYILGVDDDKIIHLWEAGDGNEIRQFKGNIGSISSVCFSQDGRYTIFGSDDGTISIWEFDWEWEFPDQES
jgi:WD40 repeat protein